MTTSSPGRYTSDSIALRPIENVEHRDRQADRCGTAQIAEQRKSAGGESAVHMRHCESNPFAGVTMRILIAQFDGLVNAGQLSIFLLSQLAVFNSGLDVKNCGVRRFDSFE